MRLVTDKTMLVQLAHVVSRESQLLFSLKCLKHFESLESLVYNSAAYSAALDSALQLNTTLAPY